MKLTVIGCSGSIPGPDSPASCYLVQAPYEGRTFSLLLDLGPGALGVLQRYLPPDEVDAIAFSHLHPDHCLDLCGFYVSAVYSPSAPHRGIPIFGPADTAARLARAYEVTDPTGTLCEPGPGIAEFFDYRTWATEQQIGPFTLRTAPADHPVEAYSIRVTENIPAGGTLVFSGDTGPTDALIDLATGADLLLAEAVFMDGPSTGSGGLHLTGRQAAEHATRAGVGLLLLTHIPPWHEPEEVFAEATPHFDGPIQLAETGAQFLIGEETR